MLCWVNLGFLAHCFNQVQMLGSISQLWNRTKPVVILAIIKSGPQFLRNYLVKDVMHAQWCSKRSEWGTRANSGHPARSRLLVASHSLPDVQVRSSVGMGTREGEILGCFHSRDQALLPLWAGWRQWTYFQHLHFSGGWGMNFSRLPQISPLLWLFINQFAHLYYQFSSGKAFAFETSIYNFTSLYPKFFVSISLSFE